jgi:hypothetical protein
MFLRNIGTCVPYYMTSHHKRLIMILLQERPLLLWFISLSRSILWSEHTILFCPLNFSLPICTSQNESKLFLDLHVGDSIFW